MDISKERVLQSLMGNSDGRHFVYSYLSMLGVYGNIFSKDHIIHAYDSGRRSAGLDLERDLKKACFNNYQLMIKENEDV